MPWLLKAWATRVVPVNRSRARRAPLAAAIAPSTGTSRRLEPMYLITRSPRSQRGRDRLGEVEDVVGVDGPLHLDEARQVVAVVGGEEVGLRRVDVVDVGAGRRAGEAGARAGQPGEGRVGDRVRRRLAP